MKAAVFHRPKKVSVDKVPDPKLENQSDAIVGVTATAICGQFGQAQVHHFIDDLLVAVEQGKVKLDDIITHSLPLSKAAEAYEMFNAKKDNCEKVVLEP